MIEKKIEPRKNVELITCDICGNIHESLDERAIFRSLDIGGKEYVLSMSNPQDRTLHTYCCYECFEVFVAHADALENELQRRVGLYNLEIVIKEIAKDEE